MTIRCCASSIRVAVISLATLAGCGYEPPDEEIGTTTAAAVVPVTWTKLDGVSAAGNDLTKTSSERDWNTNAISAERFSRDGYLEFTTGENDTSKIAGLEDRDRGTSVSDIDFGIHLKASGMVAIRERNQQRGSDRGPYSVGDVFRVQVVEGIVTYWQNGALLHTSTSSPVYSLVADTSLKTPGATILDAVIETDMFWTGVAGASADGRVLTKTGGGPGWTAGARSIRSLGVDGYAEFTTGENTAAKMAGLSSGDSGTSYEDIDFGIFLGADRMVAVREGGVRRGTFGPYEAGDIFRVQAAGGVVSYARNGVVFFTNSAAAPVFPLLLDTSLRTPGATIEAVSLVEIPGPAVVFDNSDGAFVWTPTWDSDDGFEQGAFLDPRHPAAEQTGEPSRSAIEFVKEPAELLTSPGAFYFRGWQTLDGPRAPSFAAGDDIFIDGEDLEEIDILARPPLAKNPGDAVGAHDRWVSGDYSIFVVREGVQTAHFQDPSDESPPSQVWFMSGIVGVRFRVSGQDHYGFVDLAWDERGGGFSSLYVPLRWGYNPVPNQPVLIPP